MSATTIVWLVSAVGFVVLLALAGAQALGALRELKRAKARVAAYADLPVVAALATAQADVLRLQSVAPRVAPLLARVQPAVTIIRRGPIPPELPAAIAYVRTELAALRRFRAG